jgi:toxin FitB
MYLLDTNVLSELRRPTQAHANVVAWAKGQFLEELYLSAVTILEIEMGCLQMQRRDSRQGDVLRQWIETSVLARYHRRILSIDTMIARECARLHVPDPQPERDALIAATALAHGLTLVTRNTKDFKRTGVKVINPWL